MEHNIELKPYNTFSLDCKAKEFLRIEKERDLSFLHKEYGKKKILFLGLGANIVFVGKEFDGLVVKLENKGISVKEEDKEKVIVEVGAGEVWNDFVDWACEKGLSGIENLSGIPSSVGAAPVQNIGAYGMELKDSLEYVVVFDLEENRFMTLKNEDCCFSYRNSVFKYQKGNLLIWKVGFRLSKEFKPNLTYKGLQERLFSKGQTLSPKLVAQTVRQIRDEKLPDYKVLGNVGSFFKNPVITRQHYQRLLSEFPDIVAFDSGMDKKISAAYLIEKCGYKGKQIKNVGMHSRQALVMVNYGKATGSDVLYLAKEIQKSVKEKFDIDLNIEAHIIG